MFLLLFQPMLPRLLRRSLLQDHLRMLLLLFQPMLPRLLRRSLLRDRLRMLSHFFQKRPMLLLFLL
jgi:hypothetical protein